MVSSLAKKTSQYSGFANLLLQIGLGNIDGHSIVHKFGRNANVASGVWEGIWAGSTLFNFLQAATTVRIKAGGDAADTFDGLGAQKITIEGLDSTGALAQEDIVTAGASASSATTTSFWRVFRMFLKEVGAYGVANTGAMMLENSGGGTDLISIAVGEGQSQYGAYAIPLGKTGYLLSVTVEADANKAADFRIFTRQNLTDVTTPFSPKRLRQFFDGVLGEQFIDPKTPMVRLPALTDIWGESEGSGASTEVTIDMEILVIDN